MPINPRLGIILNGAFIDDALNATNFLFVYVQLLYLNEPNNQTNEPEKNRISYSENVTSVQVLSLAGTDSLDTAAENRRVLNFNIGSIDLAKLKNKNTVLRVRLRSNVNTEIPLQMGYDPSPIDTEMGVIYAAILLIGLYVLIIWDIVHRTFAAILASTTSIAILAAMNEKPSMAVIISWIDVETLLLLFGMMILVAILSETGVFDYLAVLAYKVGSTMLMFISNLYGFSMTDNKW